MLSKVLRDASTSAAASQERSVTYDVGAKVVGQLQPRMPTKRVNLVLSSPSMYFRHNTRMQLPNYNLASLYIHTHNPQEGWGQPPLDSA